MRAFIADLHLQQEQAPTLQQAVEFAQWAEGRCEHLYILGDLFEYWLGDDSPLPGLQVFDTALKSLSAQGCALTVMHGNRDFLLGEKYCQSVGANLVRADHMIVELGDRQALLLHGDTLCTEDIEYQQARRILRSEAWQSQFTALPIPERHQQAQSLRRRSREDSATKAEQIMDVTESAVATLCEAAGVDLIIHGHTHRPQWHKLPNYERVVLGDWQSQGAYVALYDNTTLSLKHWPFRA